MKKTMLLVLPLIALACGGRNHGAQGAAAAPPSGGVSGSATFSGPFMAEVVAVDTQGPSVTLKGPAGAGGERTIRVEGAAATALDTVKKGDQVHVTCRPVSLGGTAGATGSTGGDLGSCETVTALTPMASGGSMGR